MYEHRGHFFALSGILKVTELPMLFQIKTINFLKSWNYLHRKFTVPSFLHKYFPVFVSALGCMRMSMEANIIFLKKFRFREGTFRRAPCRRQWVSLSIYNIFEITAQNQGLAWKGQFNLMHKQGPFQSVYSCSEVYVICNCWICII